MANKKTAAHHLLAAALGFLLLPMSSLAHDARPVFVQISETSPGQLEIHWKAPVSMPAFALPAPVLPDFCQTQGNAVRGQVGDAYTLRQTFDCQKSLQGAFIGIHFPNNNPGLSTLFRVELNSGEHYTHILKPGDQQWQIPATESFLSVAKQYTLLGVEHIFAGVDHLLFVACLVFIAGTARRILITITGFTLAHSLTLVLATLDLVRLPGPPVEAAIALSIVFLAHEIIRPTRFSWTWRYPVLVSSSFGLLHGFGFASVLQDIGLPQAALATGLVFFNLGVEVGQILFIVPLLAVFAIARKCRAGLLDYRPGIVACCYAIGITASYWLVERMAGFTP